MNKNDLRKIIVEEQELFVEKKTREAISYLVHKLDTVVTSENIDTAIDLLKLKDPKLAAIISGFKIATEELIKYIKAHKKEIKQISTNALVKHEDIIRESIREELEESLLNENLATSIFINLLKKIPSQKTRDVIVRILAVKDPHLAARVKRFYEASVELDDYLDKNKEAIVNLKHFE